MDVVVGVGLGLSVFIFFQWVCILRPMNISKRHFYLKH